MEDLLAMVGPLTSGVILDRYRALWGPGWKMQTYPKAPGGLSGTRVREVGAKAI